MGKLHQAHQVAMLREAGLLADETATRDRRLDWLEELGNLPVQFWVCPVREHRDANGWLAATVEWDGDVARCLYPGCTNTNASRPAGDGSTTAPQGEN